MADTDLRLREEMLKRREIAIKAHLDMLIQKSEGQVINMKGWRKQLDEKENDFVTTLENVTEYIENTDWHLMRAIELTRDYLNAKRLLEEEQDKLSKGDM